MNSTLAKWDDLAAHPSIKGKRLTVINPLGISLRGPIASVRVDKVRCRVHISIRSGEMEMSTGAERPVWVPASDIDETISFVIGANCTPPALTPEATTAMIGVGISLSISNIVEHPVPA
jgi:hypothetical protein